MVKLIEVAATDGLEHRRVELTRRLAELDPDVVGPLDLGAGLVTVVDSWQAVCYPYVPGVSPDPADRLAVEAMAAALARLHRSLERLPHPDLPEIPAHRPTPLGQQGRVQLVHGDYATSNLIATPSGLRIIDFDDCGLGSIEAELGNSLYLQLFDAWYTGNLDQYQRFRSWFVETYRRTAAHRVDDQMIDHAIRARTRALGRWLDAPAEAPVGIRTASAAWRRRLRSFVDHLET